MKLVPPVVIDDTNMVSNAPDDDYPVWGTTKRLVEYQMPNTTLTPVWHIWENPATLDVYVAGNRTIYKQAGGAGEFSQFALLMAEYSAMDISGNHDAGLLYCVSKLSSSYYQIFAFDLESGTMSPYSVAEPSGVIRSIAPDLSAGNVYYATDSGIKFTNSTLETTPTVHDATYTNVRAIRIRAKSNTLYAYIQAAPTNGVYYQSGLSGSITLLGALSYGERIAVSEESGNIYVMTTGSDIYLDEGGAGSPALVTEYDPGTSYAIAISNRFEGIYISGASIRVASPSEFFLSGEYCISGTRVYVSLVENNIAETSDSTKWFLHSHLNRLRMFDSQLTTKTEVSGMNLIVSFTSNEIDTIGLFNVVGTSVTVIVTNGGGVVESSTQAVSTRNVVFENLPSNINAVYQVIIAPLNGVASCGNLVAGMSNAIGTLMRDVELSLVSYSKTTIDDFGRPSFTVRGRAKKLECAMRVEKTDSNRVYELFNQNDSKLCMWVGPSGYPHLTVFGWYQRFELQLGAADTAKYNLEIQGDVDTSTTETSPALATPGALEIVEAYLSAEGDGVFLLFNRAAYVGAGGSGGVVVTIGETDYPLTYVSGDGTNAFLFEFSGAFVYDETAVVDYTQPGNGLEDGDGEDLVVSTPVPLDLLYGGAHPTVVSITIAENGTTVTIVFDLPVSIGTGGSGGLTLNGAALTYVSGLPGNTAVFSVAKILQGVTVTAAYVQPGDGIEQAGPGLDLLSFSGVSVVNNSETTPAPIVPPSIVFASVNAAGNQLTVVFSEAVSKGAGYQNTDINLDGSLGGTDIGLTYVSGSGTDTWVFSIATVIRLGETVDLDYNGRPAGIEDMSGNDLAAVVSMSVTNNSDEDFSDIVLWSGLDGVISGTTYTATADDYPANHTAFVQGAPAISTTIKRVGRSSLYRPNTSPLPYVEIGIPGNTPLRIGIWHYIEAEYMNYPFWLRSSGSATKVIPYIYFGDSFKLEGVLGADITQQVYTADFAPGIWRFFELIFDPPNKKIKILMNGVKIIDYKHSTAFPTTNPINRIRLGEYDTSTVPKDYNDNLIVSMDITRDLYALALLEACPKV